MQFNEIVGHRDLVTVLKRTVDENRLPHALLFSEQPGCGALTIALALVQYIFCKHRAEDSCAECSSCLKINDLSHTDFHFVFPINTTQAVEKGKKAPISMYYELFRALVKKNPYFTENELYAALGLEDKMGLIGVSEANFIIDKLNYSAYEGGAKVVLALFPERMNTEAANRLLKSIEEPPADTYFFMITNAQGKIMPTIRSRCRLVEVAPVEKEELAKALVKNLQLSDTEAAAWSQIALGSYGNALKLINESAEEKETTELFFSLLQAAIDKDPYRLLTLAEPLPKSSKEAQKAFCINALKMIRSAYMYRTGMARISYCTPSNELKLKELASCLSARFYSVGYEIFNNAIKLIESNVNVKFIFCDLCNKLYLNT